MWISREEIFVAYTALVAKSRGSTIYKPVPQCLPVTFFAPHRNSSHSDFTGADHWVCPLR